MARGRDRWGGVRPRVGRGAAPAPAPGHASGEPRPPQLSARGCGSPPRPWLALPGGHLKQRESEEQTTHLPLFPPPLPEAGRRRGLPGSAARARAGSKGSARQLGPRRGALGRGSVNIHEAPPLLRGPPDPGARRSPLCPGLPSCAHAGAASAGSRLSPGGETSGHATEIAG